MINGGYPETPDAKSPYKRFVWHFDGACIRCDSHVPNPQGYVMLTRNRRRISLARYILTKREGELPLGIVSRHTCDNAWCINPHHIISGTIADNNRDRDERNRFTPLPGEQNGSAKLTAPQILAIRESRLSQRTLAGLYSVSQTHIGRIKRSENWRHL